MYKAPEEKLNPKISQPLVRKELGAELDLEASRTDTTNSSLSSTGGVIRQLTGSAVTIGLLITVAVIASRVSQENLFNILLYMLGLLNTMIFALYVKGK